MPLAQILAAINAPPAQPEHPVQQFIRRSYIDCVDVIGHNKFEYIRTWEDQVAAGELREHFPSLFELEADIQLWTEGVAVLRQVEGNLPFLAQHNTALANAIATRLEAIATARRGMEGWRLLLATGLHPRLGGGSRFRSLDWELVGELANMAFSPPPTAEGAAPAADPGAAAAP